MLRWRRDWVVPTMWLWLCEARALQRVIFSVFSLISCELKGFGMNLQAIHPFLCKYVWVWWGWRWPVHPSQPPIQCDWNTLAKAVGKSLCSSSYRFCNAALASSIDSGSLECMASWVQFPHTYCTVHNPKTIISNFNLPSRGWNRWNMHLRCIWS